jgi:predicted transcriptional regulator
MRTPQQIVQALFDLGLSQPDIEKKTGISQATVSRIHTGKSSDPRSSTVSKLEQLLRAMESQVSDAA